MSIRMRHTRGHTGNRRSHHALTALSVVTDKESGNARLPHRLDEATGMYRGRQIAPARTTKVSVPKVKGPSTLEAPHDHAHDHAAHAHDNAEVKSEEGVKGKVATGARPKKGE